MTYVATDYTPTGAYGVNIEAESWEEAEFVCDELIATMLIDALSHRENNQRDTHVLQ